MLKRGSEAKVNNQTILEEQMDVNYEPTQEEIYEYGRYIGIDPDEVNQRKKKHHSTNVFDDFSSDRNHICCG